MLKALIPAAIALTFTVACAGPSANADADTNTGVNTNTEANSDANGNSDTKAPAKITITDIAQNLEGIEFDKTDGTFLLSNLNAGPILKVKMDGTHSAFTSGEQFPMSTAGLQIDCKHNRLLAAAFNGAELFDNDPVTKGISHLRIYDLETGAIEHDINLSSLLPDANMYFANDIAVDPDGNAYVSDWFAGVIYKVDMSGTPSVFWTNSSGIPGGPNGLDYHPDGYLLVSVLNDGTYSKHALVKVPVASPEDAVNVEVSDERFSGFDGMVIIDADTVVGVTNDGENPGGNVFIELQGNADWTSATVSGAKAIAASTTVAVTPEGAHYVINQDFTDGMATSWTIEQIGELAK